MIKLLKSLFKKLDQYPTLRHILINLTGSYANIFFTAFFALVVVRVLHPSEYGVFSLLFGISYVLANVFDLGVSASMYSNLPLIFQDKVKLRKFLKAHFIYQASLSGLFVLIFYFGFEYLDKIFFKTSVSQLEVFLVCLSIVLFVWQNFLVNSYLAIKNIVFANLVVNFSNLIKAGLIIYLMSVSQINLVNVLFVLGVLGPLIVIVISLFYKRNAFVYSLKEKLEFSMIDLSYVLTFFLASQIFALASRMDLFIVSYYYPNEMVGFYGLAQKVVLTVMVTVSSITQIISPQFSQVKNKQEFFAVLKKGFVFLSLPALFYLMIFFIPDFIYVLLFTKEYAPAFYYIRYMSLSYILYPFISLIYLVVLYVLREPKIIAIANMFFLIIVSFGSLYLIPVVGIKGALLSLFIGYLITLLVFIILCYKKVNKFFAD
ncbi:MAG: hypothetical protein KatS3mg090_0352 [Patescibacteria group bacterium]|nr:MAG: hypothetical protein KatS3mg090_0352 [Patescibacteria group bacterium]